MHWSVLIILVVALIAVTTIFTIRISRMHKGATSPEDDKVLNRIRDNFIKLNPKYGDIPLSADSSAYTENKEQIALCLKDPETGRYYSMNDLMYVALHELAHAITASQGHGDEWKANFDLLLKEGQNHGFYDPKIPLTPQYCGVSQ